VSANVTFVECLEMWKIGDYV